jgi:hypothetical protein
MPQINLTKTDLVVLMQVLNKSLSNTEIGHSHERHLPRIIKKIDKKLLKLIENERNKI